MKRKWLHGMVAGIAVLALVVAVGCSSDDDDGVSSENSAPLLSALDDQIVDDDETLTIDVIATDADGDTIILTATNLPENASFTDNGDGTGTLYFDPGETQVGDHSVTIIASDGERTDTVTVTIRVVQNVLPPEDQVDLLEDLIEDFAGDLDDLGETILPLVGMQAGANLWAGFDCEEFDFGEFPLGKLAVPGPGDIFAPMLGEPRLAAARRPALADLLQSAIRTAAAQDGPTCSYNETTDRWEVVIDETIRENFEGIPFSLDLAMTVYVQYAGPGGFQEMPDATTTTFSEDYDVDVHLEVDVAQQGVEMSVVLDVEAASGVDVTGLNTATATLNGSMDVVTDIDLLFAADLDPNTVGIEEVTVDGGFDLQVESTNVRFATTGGVENICPTSGKVDGDVGIDLVAMMEGEREAVKGDWEMSLVFNSDGSVDMSIQSVQVPSLVRDTTVQFCQPLP